MKYNKKKISFVLAPKVKYTTGLHSFICLHKFASHKTDTPIIFLYHSLIPYHAQLKKKLLYHCSMTYPIREPTVAFSFLLIFFYMSVFVCK